MDIHAAGLLHVFPSRLAADHHTQVPLGGCVSTAQVTTLAELMRGFAEDAPGSYVPPLAELVLLRRVLMSEQHREATLRLEAQADADAGAGAGAGRVVSPQPTLTDGAAAPTVTPWTAAVWLRAVTTLRQAGVSSCALRRLAQRHGWTGAPGAAQGAGVTAGTSARADGLHPAQAAALLRISRVLAAYETMLEAAGGKDRAASDRYAIAAAADPTVLPISLPGLRGAQYVHVHLGGELVGAPLQLLNGLAQRGLQVSVRLPWDADRPQAFAWPEASLHHLESKGHEGVEPDFDDRVGEGPLAPFRRALFTHDQTAPDAPVRVWHLPAQVSAQAIHVARAVRQLCDDGVPPQEIAVVVPDHKALAPALAQALQQRGLASSHVDGARLSETLPGQALLSLATLAETNIPREALLDVWRLLGITVRGPLGTWSAARLAQALRQAGVHSPAMVDVCVALRNTVLRELEGRGMQVDAHDSQHPQLLQAEAVATAVTDFVHQVQALPQAGTLLEHLQGLRGLLEAVGYWGDDDDDGGAALLVRLLPHLAVDQGQGQGASKALFAAHAARQTALGRVSALLAALESAAVASPGEEPANPSDAPAAGPGDHYTRAEFAELLRYALLQERLSAPSLHAGAVPVLRPDAVVGCRFAHVVMVGMDGGVFPRPPTPDPILTEPLRRIINAGCGTALLQMGPVTGRGALPAHARDGWLWLECLAAARESVLMTYTTPEGEADNGRSEWIDETLRCLERTEPDSLPPPYQDAAAHCHSDVAEHWGFAHQVAQLSSLDPLESLEPAEPLPQPLQQAQRAVGLEQVRRGPRRHMPLLGAQTRERLTQHLLSQVHSTSRMDTLAMCGFRYLASGFWRLSRSETPGLAADARDQGNLAHLALYDVYADLGRRNFVQAQNQPQETKARARQVFEQTVATWLAQAGVHPLLHKATAADAWWAVLLQLETDLAAGGTAHPVALEYRFDDRALPPRSGHEAERDVAPPLAVTLADVPPSALDAHTLPADAQIRIRGSIDRVDAYGTGARTLLTLDYKRTVKSRTPGRHLQLPIYGAVGLRDLVHEDDVATVKLQAGWRGLRDGKTRAPSDLAQEPGAFRAQLATRLWQRVVRLHRGDITPDPQPEGVCALCDVRYLCRYEPATQERGSGRAMPQSVPPASSGGGTAP